MAANVAAPMALSALQGVVGMQGAKAEARGLAAQATQTRMQARSEALKYKQKGVEVLDNMLRTMATQRAAAGAGNIDAFSGSVAAIGRQTMAKGAGEYYTTREGQTIVTRQGELQALEYQRQARAVMSAARASAMMGIVSAGVKASFIGGAPSGVDPTASTDIGLRSASTYNPLAAAPSYSPLMQTPSQQFVSLLGG